MLALKTTMKLIPLFVASLSFLSVSCFATPVTYIIHLSDSSGYPVTGATLSIGGTTLTSGTAASVNGKSLDNTTTVTAASVTYNDYVDGTGDYPITYDPASKGEAHFTLTVSKPSTAFAGGAILGINFAADSSTLLNTNTKIGSPTTTIAGDIATTQKAGQVVTLPNSVLGSVDLASISTALSSIQIETGETFTQTLKLLRAVLAGNSNVSSGTVHFLRKDGTTTALTITSDASGNRSGAATGSL